MDSKTILHGNCMGNGRPMNGSNEKIIGSNEWQNVNWESWEEDTLSLSTFSVLCLCIGEWMCDISRAKLFGLHSGECLIIIIQKIKLKKRKA